MNFRYVNTRGDEIDLSNYPYVFQEGDLLNWEYGYEVKSGVDGSINNIQKESRTYSIKIAVMPSFSLPFEQRVEEFKRNVNYLADIFEYDVKQGREGRIYTDTGAYLNCMIIGSEKENWKMGLPLMFNTLKVVSSYPFWTTETMQEFHVSSARVGNTKRYPYRYPCKYIGGNGIGYLINDSHADSNFIFRIFGPVSSPQIMIGGYAYCIYENLEDGEYLKADSRKGTIVKVARSGAETNAFGKKQNRTKFFKKIPPGSLPVEWSGNFSFDITLFDERSEPRWE